MASVADAHSDSAASDPADDPERVSPFGDPARETLQVSPMARSSGADGASAAGGANHRVDRSITS